MTADLLREAAALMRSRADAAEPGRWKTWGMTIMAALNAVIGLVIWLVLIAGAARLVGAL